ncbi:mesothelin-like protein [Pristis pectinata]|uniref:mesothelin-like protein n=1 Tax=Pristis pectinata TaxID=685728 RepID=UPI00223E8BB6|nr:mesothelin-like protein [Pristis pectinata]
MKKTMLPNSNAVKIMSIITIGFFLITLNVQLSFSENQSQSRKLILLRNRVKRATDCPTKVITENITSEPTLPTTYTAEELDACLENEVLAKNLTQLGNIAFSKDQLIVLKRKLGEIYPDGLPQEEIQRLGFIITVYGPEEISTWNITDPNTLVLVLPNSPNFNTTIAIVSNYLQRSGPLNAVVLNAISGSTLCSLSEENLRTILPSELKKAKPLNISMCTQAKKDIIYGIAETAFRDQANDPNAYYPLIKPYISGAKVSDLRSLAAGNINMDYATFRTLNPVEVEQLTAEEIRNLLGENLNDLKTNENDLIVQRWINKHRPDEVESLGIGLRGGLSPAGIGVFVFPELPGSASVNSYSILLSICITVMSITIQSIL